MNNTFTYKTRHPFFLASLIMACLILAPQRCLETAIAQKSSPPGVLINRSKDVRTKIANCPSLTVLANGTYIVAHEFYFSKTKKVETHVFASSDQGKTWQQRSTIPSHCWPTVFARGNELYLMGSAKLYSDLLIRRSTDEGRNWTKPTSSKNGKLTTSERVFAQPNPVLIQFGRIWRGISKFSNGKYPAFAFSAPHNSDLLDASNWQLSNSQSIPPDLFGTENARLQNGSIVPGPNGKLFNVANIRSDWSQSMAILPVSSDGKTMSLDVATAFVEFPSGVNPYSVRYDSKSRKYWSLANKVTEPYAFSNVLALVSSQDLRDWTIETILLQHIDSKSHGFQRSNWDFDGGDIISVCATAWGSGQYPDCITFHRFKNFRELTMEDSAPILGDVKQTKHRTSQFDLEGANIQILPFKTGAKLFSNWSFVIQNTPKQFDGWSFTQLIAASESNLRLTAKRDCEIFFMTGIKQGVIDVSGWTAVDGATFKYMSKDVATMGVFKRNVKRDEVVDIPRGSWTGGIVLIPPGS